MTREELIDTLTLLKVRRLSSRWVGRMIEEAGSPAAVFGIPYRTLRSWGVQDEAARAVLARNVPAEVLAEADFCEKNGIRAVGFWEDDYPALLKLCTDAPVMLFVRGSVGSMADRIVLAVVGTRSVTPYGAALTAEIIDALAPYNPVIVSGLAQGVDVAAHRAALKNGLDTVGVLGQGLGTPLYPSDNRDVARQMCSAEGCGVMTEYCHKQAPLPGLFPVRNRIVAGMARATIVVEAKAKAGALITAELASGYQREVFAVPGRTTDLCSAGCNALIRHNKAVMLDCPKTVIEELGLDVLPKSGVASSAQTAAFVEISPQARPVADILSKVEKLHIDELCAQTGLPPFRLSPLLLDMELDGVVESLPGKYYGLTPGARASY